MLSIPRNRLRRRLKRVLKILLILYVMITASLYFFQEKLLFLPTTLPQDYEFSFDHPFEEVFLSPSEGISLNVIHFRTESPKGVILYFHGNAGDLSRWGIVGEHFVSKGYDVFMMDYRSYGKSTGKLNESVFYSDAQFCYDHLLKSYSESDIVIYGRSLGTGITTYLASVNSPRQIILETPYYSILEVAKERFPFLPVKLLLKYKFESHQYIPEVKCPITIFHGTQDRIIPHSSALRLFEVSPKDHTEFITIQGGEHNNLISFEKYISGINKVL